MHRTTVAACRRRRQRGGDGTSLRPRCRLMLLTVNAISANKLRISRVRCGAGEGGEGTAAAGGPPGPVSFESCPGAVVSMVNFKRIVCEVAVALALVSALASAAPACDTERHYDQRQNGTENYRLNIDGVVIAVAPADSLLAAASEIDLADLLDLEDLNELQAKPKPPTTPAPSGEKPAASPAPADAPAATAAAPGADVAGAPKSASVASAKAHKKRGLKLRLAHLLMPLLKKSRHH